MRLLNGVLVVVLAGVVTVAAGCGEDRDVCDSSCDAVIDVSLGGSHSCAILEGGRLKCWGAVQDGQEGFTDTDLLGDEPGEMGDSLPVVDLGRDREVVAVAAGGGHTCALLRGGDVKCWGDNRFGQLGLGDSRSRGDGPGEMGNRLPVVDLGRGKTAVALVAGWAHTCALLSEGTVKCWGENRFGQLGLGDVEHRGDDADDMGDALPEVDLGAGAEVVSLAAGSAHTCALLRGGEVKCWGYNGYYQLGIGDYGDRGGAEGEMGNRLPRVDLGTGQVAVALAAGQDHTCALLREGKLKCWGTNDARQLGFEDSMYAGGSAKTMGDNLPVVEVGAGEVIARVVAGSYHTCAQMVSGVVRCWGSNGAGQLGLGREDHQLAFMDEEGARLPPVNLGEGARAVWIRSGSDHVCAGLHDGSFKCWGNNGSGQLGLGDMNSRGLLPEDMGDRLPTVQVGAGRK
ncbi:RCC1 domain-containing protein [Chondromyces crocatus]|uniref:RCC1-like domain-containing protein n=1 Tax=Chondromyces crocatus TaxID=52 RepID=A0A0K1EC22_CHOCO|nr:hypothetical protein [Chondromyces crocatus]AKT38420.1 uncharacterized protein CMC5_025660 [Chondromyces crocatus]